MNNLMYKTLSESPRSPVLAARSGNRPLMTGRAMMIMLTACAFVLFCLLAGKLQPARAAQSGNDTSRATYYRLEADVFNMQLVGQARQRIIAAKAENPGDAWIYMDESLLVLIDGYKIGDWYRLDSFQPGTAERALTLAAKARDLAPDNSQAHAHYARILILQGDLRGAWMALNKAYELDPSNFHAWYFKGIVAEHMKDAQRAEQHFAEADRLAKFDYQRRLVNIHRQHVAKNVGDTAEQERLLLENIRNNPKDALMYGNYAHFLMGKQRYAEAERYWKKAIAIEPYREAVQQLQITQRKQAGLQKTPHQ